MINDPLFIVAALASFGVLVILMIGIGGFAKGGEFNRKHSNRLMRYRIAAQAVAVLLDCSIRLSSVQRGQLMVVLSKIYTKTGDAGETALGNGARVAKHSTRVNAYGTVDETNATLGLARQHATGDMDAAFRRIQNDLFDLGADLCTPNMERDADAEYPPLRMVEKQVKRLEDEIDEMNTSLTPLRSFILPGGSVLAAHLHLCRTVCRRAERLTVELATMEEVNPEAVKYLNRLSDWFFVAGRIANNDGKDDVLWVPGLTR